MQGAKEKKDKLNGRTQYKVLKRKRTNEMVGHNTRAKETKDKLNGRTQYKVLKRKRTN